MEAAAPLPLVIAHRGASGYLPEHTLAAYALAIEQGADFIEPDLVPTRDGFLVARHENELSDSTDVAAHAEFAARRTTKLVDGIARSGWFSEDFSLEEIQRLRARERIPALRPGNAAHDGLHGIPTLDEVVALALAAPRPVGIYPETKHPSYFAREGRRLDGAPIAIDTSARLVEALQRLGFVEPARVRIQSFEVGNLLELSRRVLPDAGLRLPLVQLLGDVEGDAGPWDLRDGPEALWARWPGPRLPGLAPGGAVRWRELVAPAALAWMRAAYASGIGPWKDNLLPRRDGRLHGAAARFGLRARGLGLEVHPYTLRAEAAFAVADAAGRALSVEDEALRLVEAGATGWFIDQPDRGVAARARLPRAAEP